MDLDYSQNERRNLASYDANKLTLDTSAELEHINIPLESQRTTVSSNSGGYQPPVVDNMGKPAAKADDQSVYANKYQEKAVHLQQDFDLANASHPLACIFTVLFKGLSIFSYLFVSYIFDNEVCFILTVLLASFDFWVVKNVTGRLLVGLRWWATINEDGSEKWHFESHNENRATNPIDSRFFWFSQVGAVVFWILFSIFAVFGFHFFWASACGLALSLSATNLWAFYKCNKDYERKMQGIVQGVGIQVATKAMSSFI